MESADLPARVPRYDFEFYLGTDRTSWLWEGPDHGPLFVAYHVLAARKTSFPPGRSPFALDSGAFNHLAKHGRWTVEPREYARRVCQMSAEIGTLRWASIQDWLCDPESLAATRLTVLEHQRRTVENWVALSKLAPGIPWVPVLQGWSLEEYLRHVELYGEAGTDLTKLPIVGVGSIAKRQAEDEVVELLEELDGRGMSLHGFGVKTLGLRRTLPYLRSSDSMAWSWIGRMRGGEGARHSRAYAESYRAEILELVADAERHANFVVNEGILSLFGAEG